MRERASDPEPGHDVREPEIAADPRTEPDTDPFAEVSQTSPAEADVADVLDQRRSVRIPDEDDEAYFSTGATWGPES